MELTMPCSYFSWKQIRSSDQDEIRLRAWRHDRGRFQISEEAEDIREMIRFGGRPLVHFFPSRNDNSPRTPPNKE